MAYCGPRGIPLSEFLAWSEADQDAALAHQAHESRRCPSCGHHPDDGPSHAHVSVCTGCQHTEAAAKGESAKVPGARVRLAHGTPRECPTCQRIARLGG